MYESYSKGPYNFTVVQLEQHNTAGSGAIPENALLPALHDHNQQQKSVISGHKQAPLQVTFAAETLPFHIFAKLSQAPAPAGWLS